MEADPAPKKKKMLDLDDDDDDKSKSESKSTPSLDKAAGATPAASPSRFMNMIYSFTGFLTRRKQAHLGKPASTIQWNAEKGRYVIEGESESEEEERAPPPKFTKKEDKK